MGTELVGRNLENSPVGFKVKLDPLKFKFSGVSAKNFML